MAKVEFEKRYAQLTDENKQKVNVKIEELLEKQLAEKNKGVKV